MGFILIPSFLDFNLQPIAKKVKSYIKHTNDFLKKLHPLTKLPDNSHFCTIEQFGQSLLHPIVFYLGTWGRKGKEFCRKPL